MKTFDMIKIGSGFNDYVVLLNMWVHTKEEIFYCGPINRSCSVSLVPIFTVFFIDLQGFLMIKQTLAKSVCEFHFVYFCFQLKFETETDRQTFCLKLFEKCFP